MEEAIEAVSTQQNSQEKQENPLAGFGPNEWIVEDMYQRYLADPTSVDPAWHDFFADYKPVTPSDGGPPAPAAAPAAKAEAKADPARPSPPPRPEPEARTSEGRRPSPTAEAPSRRPTGAPANGAGLTPLRGVAARIVQNMDASLTVPTATSVRAVPAKLLVDNRIVINNHLARGRGGKVSFTHLIGYAMVRALAAHPEMNNSFAEVDGKPNLVTPEHVNLGIAIDLAKPDGTRTLVVPSIKAAEQWTSGSSGRPTRTSSAGPGATS